MTDDKQPQANSSTNKREQLDAEFASLSPLMREYVGELKTKNKELRNKLSEREREQKEREAKETQPPTIRELDRKGYRQAKSELLRGLSKRKFGTPTPEMPKIESVEKLDKPAYREAKQAFLNGLRKGERR